MLDRSWERAGGSGKETGSEDHQLCPDARHQRAQDRCDASLWSERDLGVTARMSVEFRRPAEVGDALLVNAQVVHRRGRLIDAHALLQRETDGVTIDEADGRFMRVTPQQAAAWREAYAAADSNSAFARAAQQNAQQ